MAAGKKLFYNSSLNNKYMSQIQNGVTFQTMLSITFVTISWWLDERNVCLISVCIDIAVQNVFLDCRLNRSWCKLLLTAIRMGMLSLAAFFCYSRRVGKYRHRLSPSLFLTSYSSFINHNKTLTYIHSRHLLIPTVTHHPNVAPQSGAEIENGSHFRLYPL